MAILDSSALIDFGHGKKSTLEVLLAAKQESELKATTISVFELAAGSPAGLTDERRKLFDSMRVLEFTREHAEKSGAVRRELKKLGQDIGALDSMIAGAALCENEPLITANAKHFKRVEGLRVITY